MTGAWTLTRVDAEKPVFLGSDINDETQQLLEEQGVATTRRPDYAVVALLLRSAEVPPSARWVHCPFMGVNSLVGRLPESVAVLTRTIDGMPERMASYTATAVLTERWQWHQFALQQVSHTWQPQPVLQVDQSATVVIVGTGQVGQAAAQALRPFFGSIIGVSLTGRPVDGFDQVYAMAADQSAAKSAPIPWHQADTLVVTLPLTDQTHNLIGQSILSALPGSHLVLIGRGATVDFAALHEAVASRTVRHATIDVFPQEPLPTDSWLWDDPHISLSPHISGVTRPSDAVTSFVRAREALLRGEEPIGLVQPERGY